MKCSEYGLPDEYGRTVFATFSLLEHTNIASFENTRWNHTAEFVPAI